MTDPTPESGLIDTMRQRGAISTPARCIVEGRFIYWGGYQVISVLADPDVTHDSAKEMRAALVQCVRDADRLRQARELSHRFDGEDVSGRLRALLDLLVDGGGDG